MSDFDTGQTFEIIGGANKPASTVGPNDYCAPIHYVQVSPASIELYLTRSRSFGRCLSIPFFFGLSPGVCGPCAQFQVPTDQGIDPSLPTLPLGYHYPQTSTDKKHGRARAGRWAIERGKLFIAPYIQSTETILIMWDGIKTRWADGDQVTDNPTVFRAVCAFLKEEHERKWGHDYAAAAEASKQFLQDRQELWYDCREQTRTRDREQSVARGSNITQLFYNTEQSFTAQCQEGTTGSPVTVTIAAGTIGSVVSIADANQKAKDEAQQQATDRLSCTTNAQTFTNDQQSWTAQCTAEEGAPAPDGQPKTVVIPAGKWTAASKQEANALALQDAQQQAEAELSCTWWNREQTASCPTGQTGDPVTISAHSYSSAVSQADADSQAAVAARNGLTCSGGQFWNTPQTSGAVTLSPCGGNPNCVVSVTVKVSAHYISSTISVADANQGALNFANQKAYELAVHYCSLGQCGTYPVTIP